MLSYMNKWLDSSLPAVWSSGNAFATGAEVRGSNLGPFESDTVLPTVRYRCVIFSKEAELPWLNEAEMGSANSLHASA